MSRCRSWTVHPLHTVARCALTAFCLGTSLMIILGLVVTPVSAQSASKHSESPAAFDHDYQHTEKFLQQYVSDALVDYAAVKEHGQGRLRAALAPFETASRRLYESWTSEQQIAFWINAYNLYTIKYVVDNYPVDSIRSIGFLPGSEFRDEFIAIRVNGMEPMSLNEIEHETLRTDFSEPRIHFALVCAAVSCPPLRSESYRASDLEEQLEDQGRTFLRNDSKNRYDAATNTLYLSSIFSWFEEDFVDAAGSVKEFVTPYFEPEDARRIGENDPEIEFLEYDWTLNEQ